MSGHGLSVTVLTYGAIVQDVRLDGVAHGLTVGSDLLTDYENEMRYFGCVVGPVANRLQNAEATIDGKPHRFEANLNGRHTLHSGTTGAQSQVWFIDEITENGLALSLILPNGHGGFPGNRRIEALYEIISGPTLRLTLTTTTDAPSIANATNHSYWNLDGSNDISGHSIAITANSYLPTDDIDALVTGEIRDVTGTPYDLREMTPLTPAKPPLDHTFCVARNRGALMEYLKLTSASGVAMSVATTEAGVHIYDARDAGYCGVAIEAQGWPDAPNKSGFPSIEIAPDKPAVQITEWRFSKG
nr:aldose epimerase family protein [Octadecabacter dasysiphoniae]